jgi:hypothetical protein
MVNQECYFEVMWIRYNIGTSILLDIAHCNFWLSSKLKKCPEPTKICWHSWHPTCDNIVARYSRRLFSKLLLAVAPSSHKVRHDPRRVFEGDSNHWCTGEQILLSKCHSSNNAIRVELWFKTDLIRKVLGFEVFIVVIMKNITGI